MYMAPAVLKAYNAKCQYDVLASDLWSVGIILWELLLGSHPYANINTIEELLQRQKLSQKEIAASKFDYAAKSLLSKLLRHEESERLSLHAAISFVRKAAPNMSPRLVPKTSSTPDLKDLKGLFVSSHDERTKVKAASAHMRTNTTLHVTFRAILSKSCHGRIEGTKDNSSTKRKK